LPFTALGRQVHGGRRGGRRRRPCRRRRGERQPICQVGTGRRL